MPTEPEPRFIEMGDRRPGTGSQDVANHGPTSVVDLVGRRRVLVGVLIVTLAVALGFLAGRAAGSGAPAAKTAAAQVTTTVTAVRQVTATKIVVRQVTARPAPSSPFNELIGTGARCSAQNGHQLQLGVEVRNEFDVPVTLVGVQMPPYAPGDELRPVRTALGACGQLPGSDNSINGYRLAVGASVWITVTVDVLVDCPAPLHLTIPLDYSQSGHAATTKLYGFPDLGGVPYTGCH